MKKDTKGVRCKELTFKGNPPIIGFFTSRSVADSRGSTRIYACSYKNHSNIKPKIRREPVLPQDLKLHL